MALSTSRLIPELGHRSRRPSISPSWISRRAISGTSPRSRQQSRCRCGCRAGGIHSRHFRPSDSSQCRIAAGRFQWVEICSADISPAGAAEAADVFAEVSCRSWFPSQVHRSVSMSRSVQFGSCASYAAVARVVQSSFRYLERDRERKIRDFRREIN